MTPELQKYYEDRFAMMATQGWKDFIADVQEMRNATNNLSGIEDLRKLGIRQGEVSMMDWLLSIQKVSEEAYAELTNEEPT